MIEEIKQLSLFKRLYVVEETLKSIHKEEQKHQMEVAADVLYNDYATDKELTAFTSLDFDNFYETK